MADKLDEILGDYREAVISVFEKAMGGDFTPIDLPNDQNLKAAIAAHYKGVVIKELTELERYLDLPYHEIAKKAVSDRIKELEQQDG